MNSRPDNWRCLVALLLGLAASSCSTGPWRRADDFVARLRCGMTEVEVAAEAKRYRHLGLRSSDDPDGELVAKKGQTLIAIDLESGEVQSHQVNWVSGFMRRTYRLKEDLCSGLNLVELHLVGPSADAGAAVLLDGIEVTQLSSFGTASLDVPLGEHRVSVETPDERLWTKELTYDDTSPGYDRLVIEFRPDSLP